MKREFENPSPFHVSQFKRCISKAFKSDSKALHDQTPLSFFLKPLQKNPSILNQDFHSKTLVLCFIKIKGAKEAEIQGKYHLFHSSFLTLILVLSCKRYITSGIIMCLFHFVFNIFYYYLH